jgi:hypothetical protein
VKFIKASFIQHPEVNQKSTGQSGREANEVNEKRTFVPLQVPEGNKQVMSEHKSALNEITLREKCRINSLLIYNTVSYSSTILIVRL